MSKTYVVQSGDTLKTIAQRFYGDKNKYTLIKNANPKIINDLIFPNFVLAIPEIPGLSLINTKPFLNLKNDDEVSIIIADTKITKFENFHLKKSIGNISDFFSIEISWDSEEKNQEAVFKPFSYSACKIYLGKELVTNGQVEIHDFAASTKGSKEVKIQGRSKTGVLIDSTISKFPLEFNKNNLKQIINEIVSQFNIEVVFNEDPGPLFEKVVANIDESVFSFISRLAKVRGFLLSVNEEGTLIIQRANVNGKTETSIIEGQSPFLSANARYDSTKRFSTFSVFSQSINNNSTKSIVEDSSLISVFRPISFIEKNLIDGDVLTAAKWKRSKALGESNDINVFVSSWKNPKNNIWKTNEKISFKSDSLQIKKETDFLIKDVDFFIDSKGGKIAVLNLTLPETYTILEPGTYPWD